MSCKNCNGDRILSIFGKCDDECNVQGCGIERDAYYVPDGIGIGGGDQIEFDYCLDCGTIQSDEFPISIEKINGLVV